LLSACYRPASEDPCSIAPEPASCSQIDAAAVDGVIGSDGPFCYDGILGISQLCFSGPPTGTTTLPSPVSTASCATLVAVGGSGPDTACVIAADTIRISGTTQVSGPIPLVLFATTAITVDLDGVLDASSHVSNNAVGGPGANYTDCGTTLGGMAGGTMKGAGGGAGGSFLGTGGNGGGGAGADNGGRAVAEPNPAVLHGGCPGGDGGADRNGVGPGAHGNGGGAIYLMSPGTIAIHGAIDASGAGGGKADASVSAGGGGGGSGGMIVLHAGTLIASNGKLLASGGGGGGGGDSASPAGMGYDGNDPNPTTPLVAALGGSGNASGGSGGNGSALNAAGITGGASTASGGGGGGGGGAGHIIVHSPSVTIGGQVAPGFEVR
jgi:hypothetical protein